MKHYWKTLQEKTFFNYSNVYDIVIDLLDNAHFVEIGIWKGQSVCYAGVEIHKRGKNIRIDAVDTWEGSPQEHQLMNDPSVVGGTLYDEFIRNIEPIKHIVNPVRMDSILAAATYVDKSLDFVFIDGAHNYESVKADIQAWLPKVKIGGFIGGHDYGNNEPEDVNGVKKAVDEKFDKDITVYNHGWGSWLHCVKA
jgi:hypothetical protein